MPPYPKALEAFPKLRQSTLATFDTCPLTWHFDNEYGQDWSSAEAARGILWHRFMAKCFLEMAAQQEDHVEVDVALAILHETLRQADVPADDQVPCPMHEIADLYWMAKKFAHEMRWNIQNLTDVERNFATVLEYPDPEGGSVMRVLSGRPDAVFVEGENLEHAIVPDAKTGWWLPPESSISESGFFQQRCYGLLIMDNNPSIVAVTLREYYPRFSQNREATIYREQLDDIRLELAALAERFDRAYETQQWQPLPGKACSWCRNPTACPIFPAARSQGAISSVEEAERVAGEIMAADGARKQRVAALKNWSDAHGPVEIRDNKARRVMGFQEGTRTERPSKEQVDEAIAAGVDPRDLYVTKTQTRFGPHVPKPTPPAEDHLIERLEASIRMAEQKRQTEEQHEQAN